ncbi:MAG: VCBS repeat-containing protein [Gemmatimonadota bacterium]|nr:MAG: VCBS repeat-containing protein [Gemmatimonadota bacterium]
MTILNKHLVPSLVLIITLSFSSSNVSFAQWTRINIDTLGHIPFIPIPADIGGNGNLDILVPRVSYQDLINGLQDPVDGEIILYEGPSWTKKTIDDDFSWASKVIDVNDDNKVDIVAGNINAGEVVWYEAPNWTRHVVDTLKRAMAVDVADLDKDGDLDIVAAGSQRLVWYEAPSWIEHTLANNAYAFPQVADMDSDNDIDILSYMNGNALGWHENPSWTFHVIENNPYDANSVCVGDIDDDGDLDVVIGDATTGQIRWYVNPTWTINIIATFDYPWGLSLADLDNDNDLDIIATNERRSEVMWYESPLWTKHVIDDSLDGALGVSFADINDGYRYITITGLGFSMGSNFATGASLNSSTSDTGFVVLYKYGSGTGIRGDVNGDGSINLLDVLTTVNHILGTQPLEGDGILAADCNDDGEINLLDLVSIVNVILEIGECVP